MSRPARIALSLAALALLTVRPAPSAAQGQAPPPPAPPGEAEMVVIPATDTAALKAAVGKLAVVTGTVERAEWSRSGKVMNITFAGVAADGFLAVVFDRNRKAMDEAFAGDVAKTLTGKKIRLRGEVKEYGGQQATDAGRPEIVVATDSQITIEE